MDIAGLFSLAGRRALVTGASGVLGAHFARVLHGAGAAVALAAGVQGFVGHPLQYETIIRGDLTVS